MQLGKFTCPIKYQIMSVMADCRPTFPFKVEKIKIFQTKYPIFCFVFKKNMGLVIT